MFHSADQRAIWFGALAIVATAATLLLARWYHKKYSPAERLFPTWRLVTVGIYVATVLLYVPIIHATPLLGPWFVRITSTAVLSAVEALRVFAIDGDPQKISAGLQCLQSDALRIGYTWVVYVGLIVAPILTGGFVLSFFSGLRANVRYFLTAKRSVAVFSKLNLQSVALAQTLRKQENSQRERGGGKRCLPTTIVFTDVFYENNDDGHELLCEAEKLNAICLKQDIAHLRLGKNNKVQLFVIGENESENLEQAIALTGQYKTRPRTAVYVYATSVGSGYIMDSLQKGDFVLAPALLEKLESNPHEAVRMLDRESSESGFSISRMDTVYDLVLNTFAQADIFRLCNTTRTDKVISLLILGMGEYGKQILKTALWFCQMDGYKLEINVVDSGRDKNGTPRDIEEVLRQECPEIITKNPCVAEGDANYDIRFFKNFDCFSASFDDLFVDAEVSERLRRTLMAFVALGDDDRNIEAAIMLRKLFDRLHRANEAHYKALRGAKDAKDTTDIDPPRIYAVVYDDQKAKNLNIGDQKEDSYLVDYKDTPYHIRFIGALSSHYSYGALLAARSTAWDAFKYHIEWASIEKTIRDGISEEGVEKYPENAALREDMFAEEGVTTVDEIDWADAYFNFSDEVKKYLRFEYYKYSSIAKATHKRVVETAFQENGKCESTNPLCRCEICDRKRRSEHRRWVAYMRVSGYRFGKQRADRARVHPAICPWQALTLRDKFKD